MEFRELTDEMDLIKVKFPKELMDSFSRKLTKLFLSFGKIQNLSFLENFPNIKIFYISNNLLTSLSGIEKLKELSFICFDDNKIESLK